MNSVLLTALNFSLLMLAGCSLAPPYKPPEMIIPSAYKEAGDWHIATPSDGLPRGDWWSRFGDLTLNKLEVSVDIGNPDLAAASAHYEIYKAFAAEANAQLFPEISGLASATRNRQSDNRPLRGSNQPDDYNAYTLGVGANYEIDLWGEVHNQVIAGNALAQANAANLESVRLTLHSELAKAYFQLRGVDAQTRLLEDTAADYRRQVALTDQRHQQGIVSGIDVSRARTQLDEILAQIANDQARRALFEHAIATLVGHSASDFSITPAIVVVTLPDIPSEVPSALLQRRPDIAAAERRVAAANAQIGIARAAFFPTFELGLSGGLQSTMNAGLLNAPNSFWSIGPTALFTLLDAGRQDAVIAQAKAQDNEAAAQYRATVLRAFAEVEDNLALLRQQREEMTSQSAAKLAAEHTYDLAMNRYHEGIASYLEVIDADTARLRTQSAELDVSTRGLLASVDLIRSLGGGWQGLGAPSPLSSLEDHTKSQPPAISQPSDGK